MGVRAEAAPPLCAPEDPEGSQSQHVQTTFPKIVARIQAEAQDSSVSRDHRDAIPAAAAARSLDRPVAVLEQEAKYAAAGKARAAAP